MNSLIVAAGPIPVDRCDAFLVDVAEQLASRADIGDGDVNRAIRASAKKFFDPPHVTEPVEARRAVVQKPLGVDPSIKYAYGQAAVKAR
jgi:hypothetical protein